MGAGIVLTEGDDIIVVLDDGLYLCAPDEQRVELLSPFPAELGGRGNDACADLDGNIITGKLNLAPGDGSSWQYSHTRGWTLLDPDISNTNGPAALEIDGALLVIDGLEQSGRLEPRARLADL